jgi:hypothetical protein
MKKDYFQKKALTPKEVSLIYGIPEGSLANMRMAKTGAKYHKIGRRVLYMIEDVEAWVRSNPVLTKDSLPSREK